MLMIGARNNRIQNWKGPPPVGARGGHGFVSRSSSRMDRVRRPTLALLSALTLAACAAEPAEQMELPEPARFTADHLRWLEAKAENTPIGCVTELGHSSPNWRYLPLECDGVEQKGDGEGQKIPALRFDDLSALAYEETRPGVELAFDEGDTYVCTNECDNYTSRIAVFRVSGDDFDGYLAADVDARRVDEEAWRSWIEGTSFDLGE